MILPVLAWMLASILAAMVFLATFNRWAGALALSFPLIWGGPPVAHRLAVLVRGEDERFAVFGGQVAVARVDPARLSGLSTGWLATPAPHDFTLASPGPAGPVRFSITSVIVPGSPRDGTLAQVAQAWRACPGAPDPSGLWRLTAALPQVPGCPATSRLDTAFLVATTPAPVLVQCEGNAPGSCRIDLAAQGMEVTVTLPPSDLAHWSAILDTMRAVLAHSFTAHPDPD